MPCCHWVPGVSYRVPALGGVEAVTREVKRGAAMIPRICPHCGAIWYSADSARDVWVCEECGGVIEAGEE